MDRKTLEKFIIEGLEIPLVFDGEKFFAKKIQNVQKIASLLEEFDELHTQRQHRLGFVDGY